MGGISNFGGFLMVGQSGGHLKEKSLSKKNTLFYITTSPKEMKKLSLQKKYYFSERVPLSERKVLSLRIHYRPHSNRFSKCSSRIWFFILVM